MSLSAILEARERRWQTKQELVQRFRACVLSLCLNIPGPDKNPPGVERAFALLQAALRGAHAREIEHFALKNPHGACCAAILHEITNTGADGPYWLMVSPLSGFTLKHMGIRLEREHPLGRLADIDILTKTGKALSRTDFGAAPRTCFLCGEPAGLCRQKKHHSQELLTDFVVSLLEKAGVR